MKIQNSDVRFFHPINQAHLTGRPSVAPPPLPTFEGNQKTPGHLLRSALMALTLAVPTVANTQAPAEERIMQVAQHAAQWVGITQPPETPAHEQLKKLEAQLEQGVKIPLRTYLQEVEAITQHELGKSLYSKNLTTVREGIFKTLVNLGLHAKQNPQDPDSQKLLKAIDEKIWGVVVDNTKVDYAKGAHDPERGYDLPNSTREIALKAMVSLYGDELTLSDERIAAFKTVRTHTYGSLLKILPDSVLCQLGKEIISDTLAEIESGKGYRTSSSHPLNAFFSQSSDTAIREALRLGQADFDKLLHLYITQFQPNQIESYTPNLLDWHVQANAPANSFKQKEWAPAIQKFFTMLESPEVESGDKVKYLLLLKKLAVMELRIENGIEKPTIYPALLDLWQRSHSIQPWYPLNNGIEAILVDEAMINHREPDRVRSLEVLRYSPRRAVHVVPNLKLLKLYEDKFNAVLKSPPGPDSPQSEQDAYAQAQDIALSLAASPLRYSECMKVWQAPLLEKMLKAPEEEAHQALLTLVRGYSGRRISYPLASIDATAPALKRQLEVSIQALISGSDVEKQRATEVLASIKGVFSWNNQDHLLDQLGVSTQYQRLFNHLEKVSPTEEAAFTQILNALEVFESIAPKDWKAVERTIRLAQRQLHHLGALLEKSPDPERRKTLESLQRQWGQEAEKRIFKIYDKPSLQRELGEQLLEAFQKQVLPHASQPVTFTQSLSILGKLQRVQFPQSLEPEAVEQGIETYRQFVHSLMQQANTSLEPKALSLFHSECFRSLKDLTTLPNHSTQNSKIEDALLPEFYSMIFKDQDPQRLDKILDLMQYVMEGDFRFAGSRTSVNWSPELLMKTIVYNRSSLQDCLADVQGRLNQGSNVERSVALETLQRFLWFGDFANNRLSAAENLSPEMLETVRKTLDDNTKQANGILLNYLKQLQVPVLNEGKLDRVDRNLITSELNVLGTMLEYSPEMVPDTFKAIQERLSSKHPSNTSPLMRGYLYQMLGQFPVTAVQDESSPILETLGQGILFEKDGMIQQKIGEAYQALLFQELAGNQHAFRTLAPKGYPKNSLNIQPLGAGLSTLLERLERIDKERKTESHEAYPDTPVANAVYDLYSEAKGNIMPTLSKHFDLQAARNEATGEVDPNLRTMYKHLLSHPNTVMGGMMAAMLEEVFYLSPNQSNQSLVPDSKGSLSGKTLALSDRVTKVMEDNLDLFHYQKLGEQAAALYRVYEQDPRYAQADVFKTKVEWLQKNLVDRPMDKADDPDARDPVFKNLERSLCIDFLNQHIAKRRLSAEEEKKCRAMIHKLHGPGWPTFQEVNAMRQMNPDLYSELVYRKLSKVVKDFSIQFIEGSDFLVGRGRQTALELLQQELRLWENLSFDDLLVLQKRYASRQN